MSRNEKNKKKYGRDISSLARRDPIKSPYETVLIVCEGETEVNYFRGLAAHYRLTNVHTIQSGAAPISVVNLALEKAKKNDDDRVPQYDFVACVFDRDEHESYDRAISKLKDNNDDNRFIAITSNPCFEIWPLLHFNYTAKPFASKPNSSACDQVTKQLRLNFNYERKTDKDIFSKLHDRLSEAIKNAKQLEKESLQSGLLCPSTNIHLLVERLINSRE